MQTCKFEDISASHKELRTLLFQESDSFLKMKTKYL
jgi:hypothetical protein